jgi:hypothetical protein
MEVDFHLRGGGGRRCSPANVTPGSRAHTHPEPRALGPPISRPRNSFCRPCPFRPGIPFLGLIMINRASSTPPRIPGGYRTPVRTRRRARARSRQLPTMPTFNGLPERMRTLAALPDVNDRWCGHFNCLRGICMVFGGCQETCHIRCGLPLTTGSFRELIDDVG